MPDLQLVVISDQGDPHIKMVERHLAQPFILIDPLRTKLTYALEQGRMVTYANSQRLDHVHAVWYRKPGKVTQDTLKVDENFFEYARTTLENHIAQLRSQFEGARWVSNYYAIQRAESKALQLEVASRLGFLVPETIMTADEHIARTFLDTHEWSIVKTSSTQFPNLEGRNSFFFAQKVHRDDPIALTNLHLAPAIFQQAITVKSDIRVTVVGNQIFAASIEPNSVAESSARDWRYHQLAKGGLFKPTKISKRLEKLCVQLVRELKLQYGAIDFVIDPDGKEWFLEINPNGQWGFVEEDTNLPIGAAIARLLES